MRWQGSVCPVLRLSLSDTGSRLWVPGASFITWARTYSLGRLHLPLGILCSAHTHRDSVGRDQSAGRLLFACYLTSRIEISKTPAVALRIVIRCLHGLHHPLVCIREKVCVVINPDDPAPLHPAGTVGYGLAVEGAGSASVCLVRN